MRQYLLSILLVWTSVSLYATPESNQWAYRNLRQSPYSTYRVYETSRVSSRGFTRYSGIQHYTPMYRSWTSPPTHKSSGVMPAFHFYSRRVNNAYVPTMHRTTRRNARRGSGDIDDPELWGDPLSGGGSGIGDILDPGLWGDPLSGGGGRIIGDLDDPTSWADPFTGGGSILDDFDDPFSWTDPFSQEGQQPGDLDDPGSWDDPMNETPIGNVPWMLIGILGFGYLIWKRKKTNVELKK